ncbi:hypothetical protein ASPWEDRAFT_120055 [Aspergillus wentii DTO 134E9]|uniref:Uncharacterized protein n=1 Tax=Aspergillus wentii DTO 134E9 TaxID=1073089 RepID=A0A1L9R8K8_ASPWE|nr:uncharacterized protein ASPWEDRAFT_120055 [Aspergillus wentii DTO 134E9]OJJ31262.1 hypothetical protein ASPWEDRAFT_120055 [Aspergillus wentii DTO 134E9]
MTSHPDTQPAQSEDQPQAITSNDWPRDYLSDNEESRGDTTFWEDGMNTRARVKGDGRLDIRFREHTPNIANLLERIHKAIPHHHRDRKKHEDLISSSSSQASAREKQKQKDTHCPLNLNIVIQVIGSRGDIQPFVALGQALQKHGHRVRLATHLAFKDFVCDHGLEFFSIGGDPAELMAFMVRNPGLLPGMSTIRSGAIQKRRREMKTIFAGCWRSCYETGDGTGLHHVPEDPWSETVDYRQRPFVADAIIANPPSYAHVSCAEKMGIPLNMMFTMPWSPTQDFPHPLANIQPHNATHSVANFASYAIVEMMVWEGLGDLINKLRKRELGLDPLDAARAPSLVHRLGIPYTYLWSPSLLPKPKDWSDKIDVCGFSFLDAASDYTPPDDLAQFLNDGPPPIYVGFGSIVVDNPKKLTRTVFEAIQRTGQRALVAKGWGNLGSDELDVPDSIFMIGNCPHDWLFQHVSCVVHHGGAGTTAAGLKACLPTVIVPFFGDQPFWGGIVAKAGAGPTPVPHKELTTDKLVDAINAALEDSTKEKAREIGEAMQEEKGIANAVDSFHRHLDIDRLRCDICPTRPAVWWVRHVRIKLSMFAATVLVEAGLVQTRDVVLYRSQEYDTTRDPRGPLSAGAEVLYGAISDFVTGLVDVPGGMRDVITSTRHAHEHRPFHRPHIRRHRRSSTAHEAKDTDSTCMDSDGEDGLRLTITTTHEPVSRTREVLTETGFHVGQCGKHILNWLILLPTDVTLSLSKGFHNAPKLYNDAMVKKTPQVIGVKTGLRAAGWELTHGFYYGITGLITQPHFGLQKSGATGLLKGVGKGIGGVILKPVAGIWGLAGYPLDGLHKNLQRSLSKSKTKDILSSRMAQGVEEMCKSSYEERVMVFQRWREILQTKHAKNGHT